MGGWRRHGEAGGPKSRKISLFGNFGTMNIGNECTLQAMIHTIRRHVPGADIHCICSIPEEVEARHGVAAFPMSRRYARMSPAGDSPPAARRISRALRALVRKGPAELREWARARRVLRGRDMLIMTGTGMLTDSGEGTFGLPYEIFKWTRTAKACGLKVLFVGVGTEPVRRRLTRWFITSSLARADYVCFRDRPSQESMAEMGFRRKSEVFPDLAFSLPEIAARPFRGGAGSQPVVGVGLYDYRGGGAGPEDGPDPYRTYLGKISDFVEWLVDRKYPVRILIGDITYDTAVREDLRKSLGERGIGYADRGIVDEPIASISDLFRQIGTADIVVASRFHNIILSLLLAKPVLSISYNRKNDALMAETGLPEYCLPIADFGVAELIGKFSEIEAHLRDIPVRIGKRTREYRKALEGQFLRLFGSPAEAAGSAAPERTSKKG
jgi:polysaccharide pyruvyl transferase WcaK-like protein